MSNLNIILIVVFIIAAIGATLIFAGVIPLPGGRTDISGQITVWGTIPSRDFFALTDAYEDINRNIQVNYVQKAAATFDEELAEGLATGTGPDAFILPTDAILKHRAKIFPIPYSNYPITNFRQDFATIGELYLTPDGILGLPIIIDPLVMFYNRTIFDNAGIARPPEFWDEFPTLIPALTRRQGASVTQAGVAMGGSGNIGTAKEIISALVLQTGNPIVGGSFGAFESVLDEGDAISGLSFYTGFADPALEVYSWNESLPPAWSAFAAGNVGIYFGPASDLFVIRDTNPNLDFDVRPLPQVRERNPVTFGRAYAFAIVRNTPNLAAVATAAFGLAGNQAAPFLAASMSLPPARRDLLSLAQAGTYLPIFYRSALLARGWLDPDPARTRPIFNRMIADVVSGRASADDALNAASAEIGLLLNR